MTMGQSVLKHRRIKFRCWGIAQKNVVNFLLFHFQNHCMLMLDWEVFFMNIKLIQKK